MGNQNRALAVAGTVVLSVAALHAADWPQWQGPDRTGLSKESGLLPQWPAAGPPLLWSISSLGAGYGSMAIKDDRIFVQGSNGRQSVVYVLSRADGKNLWSKTIGSAVNNDRGPGPRGTPTVDGDFVYVLTENGDLACLKAQDGGSVWQRRAAIRKYSSHVLTAIDVNFGAIQI